LIKVCRRFDIIKPDHDAEDDLEPLDLQERNPTR
jgi:hypothetical protein